MSGVPSYLRKEITSKSRTYIRDDGKLWSATLVSPGTLQPSRLPHTNVSTASVVAIRADTNATLVQGTDYTIDARNGWFQPLTIFAQGLKIYTRGLYYEWFSDDQLNAYADIVFDDYAQSEGGLAKFVAMLQDFDKPAVKNLLAMAVVVEGLWSLLTELARDIDVTTPEANIPASERYRQVYQLLLYWQEKLEERAQILNLGLNKIEMFTLRRVSLTTGRLVPLYVEREFDDTGYPVRVKPLIDTGGPIVVSDDEEADVTIGEFFPIETPRGQPWHFQIVYKVDGVVQDSSLFTARFVVKTDREPTTPVTLECTTENGRIVMGGANGRITVDVAAVDMTMLGDVYVYDFAIYDSLDIPTMLLSGPFAVEDTTL